MTTNLKKRQHLPVDFAVEPVAPATLIPPASEPELPDSFALGIYNSQHKALELSDKIGGGGEGAVYHIASDTELVANIYHEAPSAQKAEKLIALAKLGNERLCKMAAWPNSMCRGIP